MILYEVTFIQRSKYIRPPSQLLSLDFLLEVQVHLAGTLGAFEASDKIDHQDETAALEVAHVTLWPKVTRGLQIFINVVN